MFKICSRGYYDPIYVYPAVLPIPDCFLPKFAWSTHLAIPVARLIPAEVSNIALTSFITATAWFTDARAAIAYVDPDDVRAVFKDVIGL